MGGSGLECSELVTEHDLYRTIGNINVHAEFKLLEIEVSLIIFDTAGFLPRREGR